MSSVPTEQQEQIALVRRLRAAGLLLWATPNGGKRSRLEAIRMKAGGVLAGVPDLLIATPAHPGGLPTVVELKRSNGKPSQVSKAQRAVLAQLVALGWSEVIGYGCDDAVTKLRALGYGLP